MFDEEESKKNRIFQRYGGLTRFSGNKITKFVL